MSKPAKLTLSREEVAEAIRTHVRAKYKNEAGTIWFLTDSWGVFNEVAVEVAPIVETEKQTGFRQTKTAEDVKGAKPKP